jgi:hypothetical protein
MIASMVAHELRGEQGPEIPRKTSKRRSKLKQAAKEEKDAETPGERTQFLVSAAHINHKKAYQVWIVHCSSTLPRNS